MSNAKAWHSFFLIQKRRKSSALMRRMSQDVIFSGGWFIYFSTLTVKKYFNYFYHWYVHPNAFSWYH